jgi:hypothetical protein
MMRNSRRRTVMKTYTGLSAVIHIRRIMDDTGINLTSLLHNFHDITRTRSKQLRIITTLLLEHYSSRAYNYNVTTGTLEQHGV